MFLVLPIYLDVSHLKDEGFLVDELLDLEVVLPIGLTAHDASVEWKWILESGRRENDDNLTAESTSSKTNNKRAHVDRGFPYYKKPRFDAMVKKEKGPNHRLAFRIITLCTVNLQNAIIWQPVCTQVFGCLQQLISNHFKKWIF